MTTSVNAGNVLDKIQHLVDKNSLQTENNGRQILQLDKEYLQKTNNQGSNHTK